MYRTYLRGYDHYCIYVLHAKDGHHLSFLFLLRYDIVNKSVYLRLLTDFRGRLYSNRNVVLVEEFLSSSKKGQINLTNLIY